MSIELIRPQVEQHYNNSGFRLTNNRGEPADWHYGLSEENGTYDPCQAHNTMAAHIEHVLNIKGGNRILDAGCGTGSLAFKYSRKHPEAQFVGINIAAKQLNFAQQCKLENTPSDNCPHFSFADFSKLPFPEDSFHRALFMESISHSPDMFETLTEVGRVLKKDEGKLVIFDSFSLLPAGIKDADIMSLNNLWLGPGVIPITQLEAMLSAVFNQHEITPLTQRVFPSVCRLAKKSRQTVCESGMADGAVLLQELMTKEKAGYFQIVASEPRKPEY